MLTLSELSTAQRGFVRALYAAGGAGSAQQIGEYLSVAPEDVLALFHGLPGGWAQITGGDHLTLTSAGRIAIEHAF